MKLWLRDVRIGHLLLLLRRGSLLWLRLIDALRVTHRLIRHSLPISSCYVELSERLTESRLLLCLLSRLIELNILDLGRSWHLV